MHESLSRYWGLWAITAVMFHVVLMLAWFFVIEPRAPRQERRVRVSLFEQRADNADAATAAEPAPPTPPQPQPRRSDPADIARSVNTALRRADAVLARVSAAAPQPDARLVGKDLLDDLLAGRRFLPVPLPVAPGAGGPAGVVAGPVVPISYRARSKSGRSDAIKKFGGNDRTEAAVDLALQWLAAHQEPTGQWDRLQYIRHDPPIAPSGGVPTKGLKYDFDPGLTGLVTLAFLGRGYDHVRPGKYRLNVKRALGFLLRHQQDTGRFGGRHNLMMYNHALATLAVAEAYILTSDRKLKRSLRNAVAFLVAAQQSEGGWDYLPAASGRNDTSITGWVVMALRSAHSAGVAVPQRVVLGAMRHFQRATEADGMVWYSDKGIGVRGKGVDGNGGVRRYGPGMVAVGLFSRLLLGWDPDSRVCRRAAELIIRELPNQRTMRNDASSLHSYYYWYYGTLAMFHVGGDYWKRWNVAIRREVLAGQQRTFNSRRGSWQPYGDSWGLWGKYGGRVYATALNALTLEVYYRYLPLYTTRDVLLAGKSLRTALSKADRIGMKRAILEHAGELLPGAAESVLLAGLNEPDISVRLSAALALAEDGSRMARPVLRELIPRVDFKQGAAIARALGAMGDPACVPLLIEQLDGHWVVAKAADASLRRLTDAEIVRSGGIGRGISRETVIAWKKWWQTHKDRPPYARPQRGGTATKTEERGNLTTENTEDTKTGRIEN